MKGVVLLAKFGEIALKGQNRGVFENQLKKQIKKRLSPAGDFHVYHMQSTFYIEPMQAEADMEKAAKLLQKVFGLSAIHRAFSVDKTTDRILEAASTLFSDDLERAASFKVVCKRADKNFPLNSMELAALVGGAVLERWPHLVVDLFDPACTLTVEVRDKAAYLHTGNIGAAGGMPTGTGGRVAVMLSGGIDSPVAAYMIAKRGASPVAVHFLSPPYTGEQALDKVVQLSHCLAGYVGSLPLFLVNFSDVQVAIHQRCAKSLFTVLMRRSMMRITEEIAKKDRCQAIVTGESLGQVASQTIDAIACTDDASALPVFRPLIGMDKSEIVEIARRIETYDISIRPFEDCCTIFTPKHPKTKPGLSEVIAEEEKGAYRTLEYQAAEEATVRVVHFYDKRDWRNDGNM